MEDLNIDNEYYSRLNRLNYEDKKFIQDTIQELMDIEIKSMINATTENATNNNRGAIRVLNQVKKHLGII